MSSVESVSGLTRLLAIIGDPIARVRAPQLINRELISQQRENVLMIPLHVAADGLRETLEGLRHCQNFSGAVITMPHKRAVIDLLDDISPEAQLAGACNVIKRLPDGKLSGTLYDGEGFVAGLQLRGYEVAGKRVYLSGAGGAASAIAHALASHGVTELIIYNRSEPAVLELAANLARHHPGLVVIHGTHSPAHCDIAINATPVGMGEDTEQAFSLQHLSPGTLVCDIIIYPEKTPLLLAAEQAGLPVHTGEAMLSAQISLMLKFMLES